MLALAPLSECARLRNGVEVAGLECRDDFRQALIPAADEGFRQLPLELRIAAGEFLGGRPDRSPAPRPAPSRSGSTPRSLGRPLDRFAEVRIHAGGQAFFAILAHHVCGERNDRQSLGAATQFQLRIRRVAVNPSITGIWQSINTASKFVAAILSRASAPLFAMLTSAARFCSIRCATR